MAYTRTAYAAVHTENQKAKKLIPIVAAERSFVSFIFCKKIAFFFLLLIVIGVLDCGLDQSVNSRAFTLILSDRV